MVKRIRDGKREMGRKRQREERERERDGKR